ncbi:MAG: ABC transporter permease [Streptosporangiales bacterium]|nr:ABC transporter permease [Streptosporangiales bacterium]
MTPRFLVAVGNEVRKGLRFAWSERLQILIELPMFGVFILLLGPLLGAGENIVRGQVEWTLDSETVSIMLVWFLPFTFFYMQVVKMFWRLLAEIQTGTIEQVYLSPLPSWLVAAAGRVVAALIETLFVAAGTFAIVAPFTDIRIDWNAAALIPAFLITLAAIGVSLIIAGATLVWKRIQLANDFVLTMVMLFSASAIPLITVPNWWATIGHFFPLTDGVGSLYRTLFTDQPVTDPWGQGGLVWLLTVSLTYLATGIAAFGLGERIAKHRGTLGRY